MNDDTAVDHAEMVIRSDGTIILRGIIEVEGGDVHTLPAFAEVADQFTVAAGFNWTAFLGGFMVGVGVVLLLAAWLIRREWGKGFQL